MGRDVYEEEEEKKGKNEGCTNTTLSVAMCGVKFDSFLFRMFVRIQARLYSSKASFEVCVRHPQPPLTMANNIDSTLALRQMYVEIYSSDFTSIDLQWRKSNSYP